MIAKTERNNHIVDLYNLDPVKNNFASLGRVFGISKITVREIYLREMAKRGDSSALSKPVIRDKYPYLATPSELSPDSGKDE